jgi:hypothetical protein
MVELRALLIAVPSKALLALRECEDEFGGASSKHYDRPILCDFVYNLLPVIDSYNKQRQDSLQVEES